MKYMLLALLTSLISFACSDVQPPTALDELKPNLKNTTVANFFFTIGPFTVPHPCTGEPVTYGGNAHVLSRRTDTPTGGSYFTFHVNMQGVGGETASGKHFTLVQTSNDQLIFRNGEESALRTLTHNAITGGASPNFLAHTTFKILIDANNQTTIVVDNVRVECQEETPAKGQKLTKSGTKPL